jgi:hypothetical protein
MNGNTIRELFGTPEKWINLMSDGTGEQHRLDDAVIVDVFVSGNQVAIYTRDADDVEALSGFQVDDPEVRGRIALALSPGSRVRDAVNVPF